jgi:hypothetical protein
LESKNSASQSALRASEALAPTINIAGERERYPENAIHNAGRASPSPTA